MVAASHPPLTSVMTERPCELFHMDLVGLARVCSAGRKWYVLVIVDDYSRYAWVFFLADKGETFGFVRDLILRLMNERHGDVVRAIRSDNDSEFKNSHFETFCRDWVSNISFLLPMWLVRMVWLRGKFIPFVRWLGQCLMSIGLRGDIGRKR
jgi:transposase InsO family protein